ncbi:MAG: hypothetical protein OEV74_18015 [Cyclobacteriaceae bacterium]|nr:hypothetical protein [Cyclobacteriaceae bacterium]MDH4298179.1 hypothetical protein [Cyclobacteriaceae bacterium]MDH5248574.1 hypothetical protein [Cyclobacteriaceae bacterium]
MLKYSGQRAFNVARHAARELVVFSKLERLVAAVCMGTPFFLILADSQDKINFWPIAFGTFTIMAIPLIVSLAAYKIYGMATLRNGILAFVSAFILVAILFYIWYQTLPANFIVRDSISSYVSMKNAQIFGLLLTSASMLFLFNGAVYINTVPEISSKKHGKWYNLVLGISLLGVVLFPCTNPKLEVFHYSCAILFFAGGAFVIAFFNNEEHRIISIIIAGISLLGFVVYLSNTIWLKSAALSSFSLFWAETIALWVIGIHYILESLGELS